jgi:hypothetical protein
MITDANVLNEIRSEWASTMAAWDMVQKNIAFSFAGGGITMPAFHDFAYTLPVLFGLTVVEHVLQQLRDEGHFGCRSSFIGPLMVESRRAVPWVDYALVDEARNRRNEVAHEQRWLPAADSKRYLRAIEEELRAWSII